jgi:hypothetical protein
MRQDNERYEPEKSAAELLRCQAAALTGLALRLIMPLGRRPQGTGAPGEGPAVEAGPVVLPLAFVKEVRGAMLTGSAMLDDTANLVEEVLEERRTLKAIGIRSCCRLRLRTSSEKEVNDEG